MSNQEAVLLLEWTQAIGYSLHRAGYWVDPLGNIVAKDTPHLVEIYRQWEITQIDPPAIPRPPIRDWNVLKRGKKPDVLYPEMFKPARNRKVTSCACCGATIGYRENKWVRYTSDLCQPCYSSWKPETPIDQNPRYKR